ncbi:MAG: hypothetical protein H0U15_11630 [Geodermatophilaceae bacterium]|nr:hypothetical protein [Geodermatophilaceae bacterium]
MAYADGPVAVRARDHRAVPLGRFIDQLAKATRRPVTEIVREAQISRAYYYVLRDSDQTPSIETLANLLTALDVDFRLGDTDDAAQFVVRSEGEEWLIHLPYAGKQAARARAVRNMTYASSLPNTSAQARPAGVGEPLYALAPLPDSPSGSPAQPAGAGRSFVVGRGPSRRDRSALESRLLSELVSAAGDLDAERLQHLVATARLLAENSD